MSQHVASHPARSTHRTRPVRNVVTGLAAILAAATLAPAAAGAAQSVVVHHGVLAGGGATQHSSSTVEADVSSSPSTGKPEQTGRDASPSKVDARLAAKAAAGGSQKVRVLITFDEDQKVPRMPDPVVGEPRSSSANVAAQARANALVAGLKARRADGYKRVRADLARVGADVVDEFWLIKGVAADVPLAAVKGLAARNDVRHIELEDTGARPPDADPANDEADARALMSTDPYFGLNQTAGWIGLLDTGVRSTHTLFTSPARISIREDLTNTTSPNPDDDCWNHGTSSAAIMSANGNLGDAFRGVSGLTVDSFKVYPAGCGGLNGTAAVNGFQRAVNVLDRVIVAEMQPGGNETSAISAAADSAFDAGAVVIAANGNFGYGNPTTVAVPAVAQKVLGIGAVDVKTLATPSYQGLGPAGDGRIKPDIQAPTNVETASSSGTTALQVFGGTSAATPHAAGAAALVRNFLRGGTGNVDPGNVYAFMLMSGMQTYPNNTNGAGRVRLPLNGGFWHGSTTVTTGQTVEIPIGVGASSNKKLNASIWWPEAPASHNDVDLSLVDPSGVVRASSSSISGVFEKVSVNAPIAGGTWKLRIRGYSVPTGPQRVHFAAADTTP